MKRVELSDPARKELLGIGDYTRSEWGEKQRQKYLAVIASTLKALRAMPKIGHRRDDLASGVRSILSGQHIVLYEEKPEVIEILHIYHASEDIEGKFVDKDDDGP